MRDRIKIIDPRRYRQKKKPDYCQCRGRFPTVILHRHTAPQHKTIQPVRQNHINKTSTSISTRQVGTFQMAVLAKAFSVPFYVAAESYKFARLFPLDQRDLPEGKIPPAPFAAPEGTRDGVATFRYIFFVSLCFFFCLVFHVRSSFRLYDAAVLLYEDQTWFFWLTTKNTRYAYIKNESARLPPAMFVVLSCFLCACFFVL